VYIVLSASLNTEVLLNALRFCCLGIAERGWGMSGFCRNSNFISDDFFPQMFLWIRHRAKRSPAHICFSVTWELYCTLESKNFVLC